MSWSWRKRIAVGGAGAACLVVAVVLGLWLNNNVVPPWRDPDELKRRIDASFEAGIQYIVDREVPLVLDDPNSALLFMIRDMAEVTDDPRLRSVVEHALTVQGGTALGSFTRMLDENAEFIQPEPIELETAAQYQRWIVYAIAPAEITLSEEDRAAMMSPTGQTGVNLTHQLFALDIARRQGRIDLDSDELIERLCQRIADEESIEPWVCDLYIQRVAFLLAAGRPDLIRRRWVERIIDCQHSSGGWAVNRRDNLPLRFSPNGPDSDHASVQGVWVMCQLKHLYPEIAKEGS